MRSTLAHGAARVVLAIGLATSGCSTLDSVGNFLTGGSSPAQGSPGYVAGFLGGVVALDAATGKLAAVAAHADGEPLATLAAFYLSSGHRDDVGSG